MKIIVCKKENIKPILQPPNLKKLTSVKDLSSLSIVSDTQDQAAFRCLTAGKPLSMYKIAYN